MTCAECQRAIATRFNHRGFTLVEMMTVVAIVAVMGAMAIPAFSRMAVRNEVQKAAREIASTLQTARLLAMNQNLTVGILPALIGGPSGQTLNVPVVNAATGLPLVNAVTGNPISAGLQTTAPNVTSIVNAGGGPTTAVAFGPQGLLSPIGAPGVVWIISNVPQNIVYSVTISPGGRVRWCELAVAPGGVCP